MRKVGWYIPTVTPHAYSTVFCHNCHERPLASSDKISFNIGKYYTRQIGVDMRESSRMKYATYPEGRLRPAPNLDHFAWPGGISRYCMGWLCNIENLLKDDSTSSFQNCYIKCLFFVLHFIFWRNCFCEVGVRFYINTIIDLYWLNRNDETYFVDNLATREWLATRAYCR